MSELLHQLCLLPELLQYCGVSAGQGLDCHRDDARVTSNTALWVGVRGMGNE